jgi:PAS domain S-box-containing protein
VREYRRVCLLILIMAAVASAIGGAAIVLLYREAFEEARQQLIDKAQGRARVIESIVRHEQSLGRSPEQAEAAALARLREAYVHYAGSGTTGAFSIVRRTGDEIVFLLQSPPSARGQPLTVTGDTQRASLASRALAGQSGTVVAEDERRIKVLAAFEPIRSIDAGIVTKIEIAEIRAPFVKAAQLVIMFGLFLIGIGTALFFGINEPLIQRIETNERRFRQLFDSMASGVAVFDVVDNGLEFVFKDFNRAAERIGGVSREDLIGRRLTEAFPGVVEFGLIPVMRRIWQTGKAEAMPAALYRDQRGSGWREVYAYKLPTDEIVVLFDDVSERVATEDHLRQAQKMEAVGQLTGGIAHDFNNFLGVIIGNLQLLEEQIGDNPERRELLRDALWSAQRGSQLIDRLLAFARRQPLQPVVTDLNALIGSMTDLLRRSLGTGVILREEFASDIWPTIIDQGQLENALINLVINARDAMRSGGTVTLRTANVFVEAVGPADIESPPPGAYVLVEVADTGEGMEPAVLQRVFEPFFTTKRAGKGSGLGLSMVYGFVKQSGGHIKIESRVGKGTNVKLFLPQAQAATAAVSQPAAVD